MELNNNILATEKFVEDTYKKNRTHWVEDGGFETIYTGKSIAADDPEPTDYTGVIVIDSDGTAIILSPISLVANETYNIELNNTTYTGMAASINMDGINGVAIGNLSLIGMKSDNNEAFIIISMDTPMEFSEGIYVHGLILDTTIPESITLNISKDAEIVHKLDNKYLDLDWLAKKSIHVDIVKELKITSNYHFIEEEITYQTVLPYIDKLKVVYDGVEYTPTVRYTTQNFDDPGTMFIGNASLEPSIGSATNTGEPFFFFCINSTNPTFMYMSVMLEETTKEHTISMYAELYKSEKLPQEFLPDHLPRIDSDKIETVYTGTSVGVDPENITDPTGVIIFDINMAYFLSPMPLVVGETYTVNLNGSTYTCTAKERAYNGMISIILGNYSYITENESDNTGESFMILCVDQAIDGVYGTIIDTTAPESITLNISKGAEIVHKLDNKFLDLDWIPKIKANEIAELLPTTTFTSNTGEFTINAKEVLLYDKVKVTFNDVDYICDVTTRKENEETTIYIGNTSLVDFNFTTVNTGEPFIIVINDIIGLPSGIYSTKNNYTVRIAATEGNDNKLPKEFLPDNIYTLDKVESKIVSYEEHTVSINNAGLRYNKYTTNFAFEVSELLKCDRFEITYNGTTYECKTLISESDVSKIVYVIPNGYTIETAPVMIFGGYYGDMEDMSLLVSTNAACTIGVSGYATKYNKLPCNYLPDDVFEIGSDLGTISNLDTRFGEVYMNAYAAFRNGSKVTALINGEKYTALDFKVKGLDTGDIILYNDYSICNAHWDDSDATKIDIRYFGKLESGTYAIPHPTTVAGTRFKPGSIIAIKSVSDMHNLITETEAIDLSTYATTSYVDQAIQAAIGNAIAASY